MSHNMELRSDNVIASGLRWYPGLTGIPVSDGIPVADGIGACAECRLVNRKWYELFTGSLFRNDHIRTRSEIKDVLRLRMTYLGHFLR